MVRRALVVLVPLAVGAGLLSGCVIEKPEYASPQAAREARTLAQEVLAALPAGWMLESMGPAFGPPGWSGGTDAVHLTFRHRTLAYVGDGRTPASLSVWVTPRAYGGTLVPRGRWSSTAAELLGASETHLWFVQGLRPRPAAWRAALAALRERFGITPPGASALPPGSAPEREERTPVR